MAGCSGHDVQTRVSIREGFIVQPKRIPKSQVGLCSLKLFLNKDYKVTGEKFTEGFSACVRGCMLPVTVPL